ncbi:MAG TPA: adenine phosphoribosyltransferase [Calditrichia bacterium]|nr:adenine phosphoribosyltransferase [Calditrichota bacterium]HQU73962.1 adenine phosphoribosyltransferase [Calditrichia bacterium]HQV32295.1 adenine phosphoribosyltransferase [Calditrichia bacterium]
MTNFEDAIRNVPDFPIKGIQFKDITTLIGNPEKFANAVDYLYGPFREMEIDKIAGIESRGFIFGAALAYKLNVGFVPIRKPGKLPAKTYSAEYQLEYGSDSLEIHTDAVAEGEKVLLIDDLLATGGTAAAACELVERCGGEVIGLAFLIELDFLQGRQKLKGYRIESLVHYSGE